MPSAALELSASLTGLHLLRRRPALRGFIMIRAADELSSQMLNVAIAWHIYSITRSPLSLAYLGLARFLPNLGISMLAGHLADHFDRSKIIKSSLLLQTFCIASLAVLLASGTLLIAEIYLLLFLIGAAQAFSAPAMSAMMPNLVSDEEFPRAVAIYSSIFQVCTLAGPAIGGLIYGISSPGVFAVATAMLVLATAQARRLPGEHGAAPGRDSSPQDTSPFAGVRYIRSNRLLLSLISLDLFAVLLGGVTALLPIYARDILSVGPAGLGCLRCAPGIGAALVGAFIAHHSIKRRAGRLMLTCVAGFGIATVVFALSANFWLSLAALIAAGGFDMVSLVIRGTLVQASTPDAMRGRVSAVQWVFIGASSELGEFESGATAALFGTVPAALLGGIGTLIAVWLWSRLFPELRRAGKLIAEPEESQPETAPTAAAVTACCSTGSCSDRVLATRF
ncbi:MAG TPA: MFS transporter [Blastocatellia bacterium]|nr:MFS transporter [Blastocatellia bacterium]